MTIIRIDSPPVRDAVTGEPKLELVGEPLQIVLRDTTTAFPIQDGAEDPIPDSTVTVQTSICLPTIWIDTANPADLYLDWYHAASGIRGPVDFDKVLRDAAAASADSAAASESSASTASTAAATTAAEVAALRQWVDLGNTTRNLVLDPRATDAASWARTGGAVATETMITDATDGPVLPDGTRVTTYARYEITTVGTGNAMFGTANFPVDRIVPVGESAAIAIYVRSSVAVPSISVRKDAYLDGVAAGASQAVPSSSIAANAWERRAGIITNNADLDEARIAAQFPEGSRSMSQLIDVVCALFDAGATEVPDHYDGDSPSTNYVGNAWSGEPNASVSEHIEMRLVRTVNGEEPDASGNVIVVGGDGSATWSTLPGKPDTFSPSPHTHTTTDLSDFSTVGKAVARAVDQATARAAIGAAPSTVVSFPGLGSTATTAAPGSHSHAASALPFTPSGGVTANNVQQAILQAAAMGGGGGTSDPLFMFARDYTSGAWPVRGVAAGTGRCVWSGPASAGAPPAGGSYSQPGDEYRVTGP